MAKNTPLLFVKGPRRVAPAPTSTSLSSPQTSNEDERLPSVRMIYSFSPTSPYELAVTGQLLCSFSFAKLTRTLHLFTEGAVVGVVEDDDGSGWIKVRNDQGEKGLVPATYVEPIGASTSPVIDTTSKPKQKAGAPSNLGSGVYGACF